MTALTAPAPTTTPAGSAHSAMLLATVPTRSRCETCKGHGGHLAPSNKPTICDDCKGLGHR